jgi:hypothetical protein
MAKIRLKIGERSDIYLTHVQITMERREYRKKI